MTRSASWLLAAVAIALAPAPALAGDGTPVADPRHWTAPAQTAPASLSALQAEARARNPELRAARARYEAARARVAGEGLMPDPMLEAGMMSLVGLMGPEVAVSQRFPLGDKLSLDRRLAEEEAEAARLAVLEAENRLANEVAETYYAIYAIQREQAIIEQTRALLDRLRKIATTRYAVGTGQQADALRASTEAAELRSEAIALADRQAALSARLAALIDQEADGLVTVPTTVPAPAAAPSLEALVAAAEAANPTLARAKRELARAEVARDRARLVATPDLTTRLGVSQAYMGQWTTAVSGMVGLELPVVSGQRREAAAVAAAEATMAEREATLAAERRRVRSQLAAAVSRRDRQAEQITLYQRGLLPQARQALEAALSTYQVGKSDFDAVLAAEMALYRFERGLARALADYHQAVAAINTLTGRKEAP